MSNPKEEISNVKNVFQGNAENIGHLDIGDKKYYITNQQKPIPKALTNNIPLLSKEKIIGRDAYLDKLHEILNEKKDAVLVNGFGGVGKTTIAQVYAHTYWDEYAHVAWITLNSDDFIFEFVNAQGLKESLNISAEGSDIQQLFDKMMVEINRIREKPNLLILDNAVEKLSQFKSYLPSTHEWHILVTAREETNGFTSHYLDFLDEADAIALFKHYYSLKIINGDQIHALVRKVEYHTLTIEILAKTAQLQRFSFETLKDALQKDIRSGVLTSRSGQEKIKNITDYLSSIFSLSELTENEIWVLKNMYCLPSDYHSYDLLKEIINYTSSSKEGIFAESLSSLTQKSWLLHNEDTDSYKMHIVVAEVLKKKGVIHFNDVSNLIEGISSILNLDPSNENPKDKFKWIKIGQHLSSNLNLIQQVSQNDENKIIKLNSNLGLILQDFGDYKGAKALLSKVMTSIERNFGPYHPTTATSYSNLGMLLKDLGDYEGAKSLLSKALISNKRNYGLDNISTARSFSNLGIVLKALGDYKEARSLFNLAITISEKKLGINDKFTLLLYSNLATLLQELGDYEGAKSLFIKVVSASEKKFDPYHPSMAINYSNLAIVIKSLGEYEEAKSLLNKAVLIDNKYFGPDHPTTAISTSNLGLVLKDLGEFKESKSLLTKALAINEKSLGPTHPYTAQSYSNLGLLLYELGDFETAKTLLIKAMVSDEKNFGPDHPSTAIKYSNLALVHHGFNEIPEAIILSKKALDIFRKTFPGNHPNVKVVEEIYNHLKSLS